MHVFVEDAGGNGNGNGRGRRRSKSFGAVAAAVSTDERDPDDLVGLDPRWRSTNAHYFASGYDRGHCAPAADFKGDPKALEASFVLSNVAPQVGPGMNRDYWARFERFVKTLAATENEGESEKEVVVFTGPLYLPQRIKQRDRDAPPNAPRYEMRHPMLGDPPRLVAVPTHFYKVALVLEKKKEKKGKGGSGKDGGDDDGNKDGVGVGGDENGGKARAIGAWVMPNAAIPPETPLTVFCVPLSALEDAAGGRFFQGVIEEEGGSTSASSTSASEVAERLDGAALRWQARGRAAALELSKNRKSVSATAEAAAALLPLAPKLAGLLAGGGGGGGKEKEEENEEGEKGGGGGTKENENDDGEHAGPSSAASSARASGAAELLLNPLPSSRREQQQRPGGGRGGGRDSPRAASSLPPPPPEPAPKWAWLFRNAGSNGANRIAHICDVTECKLPAEDWYKSFPAGGGGVDKGAVKK